MQSFLNVIYDNDRSATSQLGRSVDVVADEIATLMRAIRVTSVLPSRSERLMFQRKMIELGLDDML